MAVEDRVTRIVRAPAAAQDYPPTVLLVDDQPFVGEAVRRMLAGEKDIRFHYCNDPTQALKLVEALAPTVILQDLVMPQMDGLALVRELRAYSTTRDIPLIVLSVKEEPAVKAEAFALGANDYLVKLPDKIELIARIRYHSRGYINLLQRNEAFRRLEESQKALIAELAEAAEYVTSLLPEPLSGRVSTAWKFIPSTQLGGDSFGYHWFDEDHLAMYLLDVCGHGVGAALLSISVMNVLRARTLPGTDFTEPGQVLTALNAAFPMENHNNMYFTIWYGVLNAAKRELSYCSGGHPPAVVVGCGTPPRVERLRTPSMAIGFSPEATYVAAQCPLEVGSRLYIYSDGVYELTRSTGKIWTLDEFIKCLAEPSVPGVPDLDRLLERARQVNGNPLFDDDYSLLQVIV
ncbi:MAG: SpoIIE family protein phosphatase [Planctomycetota bacterium]|nr:SpoIIE family protein phosphatase [Planctomycetota bacterium]